MIGSLRNFAKTKFAGILVFIMIIPFVFWGMGDMFSSGNTNTIAKINKTNISTEEFIDYLNSSGVPQQTIRENLENKTIIEGKKGKLIINSPWAPGNKTTLEISQGKSYYKKLVNSDLSLFANQIKMVSDNFEKNKKSDKFLVNIEDSLSIMKNLSIWAKLIKK